MLMISSQEKYFWEKKCKEERVEKCSWSDIYKIKIHRFNMGSMVCRCGGETIKQSIKFGGWRVK